MFITALQIQEKMEWRQDINLLIRAHTLQVHDTFISKIVFLFITIEQHGSKTSF